MSPTERKNYSIDDATAKLIDAIGAATGAKNSEIVRRGVAAYAAQLEGQGFKLTNSDSKKSAVRRQAKARIR